MFFTVGAYCYYSIHRSAKAHLTVHADKPKPPMTSIEYVDESGRLSPINLAGYAHYHERGPATFHSPKSTSLISETTTRPSPPRVPPTAPQDYKVKHLERSSASHTVAPATTPSVMAPVDLSPRSHGASTARTAATTPKKQLKPAASISGFHVTRSPTAEASRSTLTAPSKPSGLSIELARASPETSPRPSTPSDQATPRTARPPMSVQTRRISQVSVVSSVSTLRALERCPSKADESLHKRGYSSEELSDMMTAGSKAQYRRSRGSSTSIYSQESHDSGSPLWSSEEDEVPPESSRSSVLTYLDLDTTTNVKAIDISLPMASSSSSLSGSIEKFSADSSAGSATRIGDPFMSSSSLSDEKALPALPSYASAVGEDTPRADPNWTAPTIKWLKKDDDVASCRLSSVSSFAYAPSEVSFYAPDVPIPKLYVNAAVKA